MLNGLFKLKIHYLILYYLLNYDIFNIWKNRNYKNNFTNNNFKNFYLNFGPQHPASHGVLRLVLNLDGEVINNSDCHIGFLHRGTEKLIENRNYLQALPYLDRLDYVSMMSQEHSYVLAVEDLLNTKEPFSYYSQIRVIFDELTRLLNHFLSIATHSLDVGNMSPVFWAFEEREKIMEFYERVSGARMHAAFYRPNELDWSGINYQFFIDLIFFLRNSFKSITEIFVLLSNNKIWKQRLSYIGIINYNDSLYYNTSGVISRSCGQKKDFRFFKSNSYSFYYFLKIQSFLGKRGDCYDRFLIRIREMYESVNIINQVLSFLTISNKYNYKYNFYLDIFKYLKNKNNININNFYYNKYNSMENILNHFKKYSDSYYIEKGFTYQSIEAPKGEFGVSLIADGSNKPYRCKFKSPAFNHLLLMNKIIEGHFFADMITILGSQDIVFGEVDR